MRRRYMHIQIRWLQNDSVNDLNPWRNNKSDNWSVVDLNKSSINIPFVETYRFSETEFHQKLIGWDSEAWKKQQQRND